MKRRLRFKTIFISDVHLGAPECKAAQVAHFLRNTQCEKLVLNGDIIDAWALRRGGKWDKPHTHFIRTILKKMEKEDTQVIYTRGNHDDVLSRFLPMSFDNLSIVEDHIHESPHGRYLVVHGDGFDHVTTNHKWLAGIGAICYLNSGDWVESLTAVVEHLDRTFEVITYADFCARSGRQPKGMKLAAEHSLEDEEMEIEATAQPGKSESV